MFDIGFWELLLVGVVALLVLGPERLPVAVRTLAHWIKLIRSTANAVKAELTEELRIQELHNDLKKAEQLNMQNLSPDLQASLDELRSAAASVNRPYAQPEATAEAVQAESLTTLDPAPAAEPVTAKPEDKDKQEAKP